MALGDKGGGWRKRTLHVMMIRLCRASGPEALHVEVQTDVGGMQTGLRKVESGQGQA